MQPFFCCIKRWYGRNATHVQICEMQGANFVGMHKFTGCKLRINTRVNTFHNDYRMKKPHETAEITVV